MAQWKWVPCMTVKEIWIFPDSQILSKMRNYVSFPDKYTSSNKVLSNYLNFLVDYTSFAAFSCWSRPYEGIFTFRILWWFAFWQMDYRQKLKNIHKYMNFPFVLSTITRDAVVCQAAMSKLEKWPSLLQYGFSRKNPEVTEEENSIGLGIFTWSPERLDAAGNNRVTRSTQWTGQEATVEETFSRSIKACE